MIVFMQQTALLHLGKRAQTILNPTETSPFSCLGNASVDVFAVFVFPGSLVGDVYHGNLVINSLCGLPKPVLRW